MKNPFQPKTKRKRQGFTLVELMMASSVMTVLVAGTVTIMYVHQQSWFTAAVAIDSSSDVSSALERMVYGEGNNPGLRATEQGQANIVHATCGSWQLNTSPTAFLAYDANSGTITNQDGFVFCSNVSTSTATMGLGGCTISLDVQGTGGRQTLTSSMQTYVRFRN